MTTMMTLTLSLHVKQAGLVAEAAMMMMMMMMMIRLAQRPVLAVGHVVAAAAVDGDKRLSLYW